MPSSAIGGGVNNLTCQADFDVSSFVDIIAQADAVAIACFYHFRATASNTT